MAERLAAGNVALALLGAATATAVFSWLVPAAPRSNANQAKVST
jgi:hypothetical protein